MYAAPMLFCRNAKSAPRSHGLYRIIVVVGVISACSDGDSVNDADASRDASPHASIDASAVRDASADDKDARRFEMQARTETMLQRTPGWQPTLPRTRGASSVNRSIFHFGAWTRSR